MSSQKGRGLWQTARSRSYGLKHHSWARPSASFYDDPAAFRFLDGKHQNERVSEVPPEYLKWYLARGDNRRTQKVIRLYLKAQADNEGGGETNVDCDD
jgi:hypothetical protein